MAISGEGSDGLEPVGAKVGAARKRDPKLSVIKTTLRCAGRVFKPFGKV